MPSSTTRKIVITGVLGAISVLLGVTHWGYIPWFAGASLTIMHVPVIIGAILEGPVVGLALGLIFGVTSLIQAAVAPTGVVDPIFTNPLVSVLPRLFIGPVAWLVYNTLKRYSIPAILAGGIAGSLTNTVLVLGALGIAGLYPGGVIATVAAVNGLPEAAAAGLITLLVVAAWKNIRLRKKTAADL